MRRASRGAILQNVSSWSSRLLRPRFIQCYYIRDYPDYPIGPEAANAAGIDLFIGERESAYRGLGPRLIREFLGRMVFRELAVDSCIIGPAQNNHAAIRAYEKAGFKYLKTVSIPGELEPEYLMRIGRDEFVPPCDER